jgi:membrane protease YdiL (CAAX protease family)
LGWRNGYPQDELRLGRTAVRPSGERLPVSVGVFLWIGDNCVSRIFVGEQPIMSEHDIQETMIKADLPENQKMTLSSPRAQATVCYWILGLLVFRLAGIPIIYFAISSVPPWVEYLLDMIGYLGVLSLLLYSSNDLSVYFVERRAFYIIVFGSTINAIMSWNLLKFLFLFPCMAFSMYILYLHQKKRRSFNFSPVKGTTTIWVGFVGGYGVEFFMLFMAFFIMASPTSALEGFRQFTFNWWGSSFKFLYELASNSVIEELMFRGFLIGFLCQKGFRSWNVVIIQAFLFWIAHVYSFDRMWFVFFSLPITALLYGMLTIRFKSILPSMVFHAVHNSLAALLYS